MSGRGRPRKVVRDENAGASGAKSPQGTRKKQVEDTKTTNAKPSASSKPQVCAPKAPSEPSKSGEKKATPRNSARTANGIKENPSKDPQSAPEKVKKSQSAKGKEQPSKTSAAKASCAPKLQESQDVWLKTSLKDANIIGETQAAKTAKSNQTTKAPNSAARRDSCVDESTTKVLQNAPVKLKVKKSQRSESAKCVNELRDKITDYLKRNLDWCKEISVEKSGSYYENLKICEPDEFDFMMSVRVERVTVQPFTKDGAFYRVEQTKRLTPTHPLTKFLDKDNTIMASEMLKEFREKIKEAVTTLKLDNVTLDRKKKGCPAVTLLVKENGKTISIDFVLGLEVHSSWPSSSQDGFKIENWLGRKVRMEQRRKPFYLVPKYEGKGNTEQDGVMAKDAWRISFSHVEKYILKNHGNAKTCCEKEQKCCRKQCLKLLKFLLQRLKETGVKEADKLCSYYAKTTLLHACASRVKDSDWAESKLSPCFQQLLMDFEQKLRACDLPNFFIPSQNLFKGLNETKCNLLADHIAKQRNNGFPLLK